MGLCLAGSVTLYAYSGAPGEQDRPFAERRQQMLEARAAAGDVNSRIRLLVDKTKQDPDQLEDWWVLARAYTEIGDHASAADAYRQAASLSGDDPNILSAYGESLTLANGNKVPQAARLIFEQILNGRPDPRARYYLALAKAQAQQFDAAFEDWAALARDSDPNAPWMGLVRRDIVNMARFTGRDINVYLPDASEAELTLAATGPAPQSAPTARSGKDSLTQRLAENPRDYKGWIALARLETADGDQDAAKAALESARQAYAGAPFVLGKIADAERELGLDLVAARRGPSEEDRQAAALMTEEERQEMIAGMVAGLAARLEERPNDPDGWVMLVRSYVVMGRPEEAGRAAERARFVFTDRPDVLAAIERGIGDVLGD